MKRALLSVVLGAVPVVLGLGLVLDAYRGALHQRVLLTSELTAATARARTLDAVTQRLAFDHGGPSAEAVLKEAIDGSHQPQEKAAYQAVLECLKAGCEHPEAKLTAWSQTLHDALGPAWEAADDASRRARRLSLWGLALALVGPLSLALFQARRSRPGRVEDAGPPQLEQLLRERLEQLYAARSQANESARFAAFGELAAGLSHGLKTPIASVLAAAQLGQLKLGEQHPARAQLDEIIREASGLLEQVQRFLHAATSVGPTRDRVELRALLAELEKTYAQDARERGLTFATDCQVETTMEIDQALLEMALKNLVENALALSARGSEVRVTASRAEAPPRAGLEGAAPTARHWLALDVEDQGPGLPASARQGQTGVTTRQGGSGLGLAIARRVVERHGGALAAGRPAGRRRAVCGCSCRSRRLRDDLPGGGRALAARLDRRVPRHRGAERGGLRRRRVGARRRRRSEMPDVLVTDVQLPGASGVVLLAELKKLDPSLVCVVMTAHASVQTAVSAMRAGAWEFVEKPVDLARLLRMVQRALEERRSKTRADVGARRRHGLPRREPRLPERHARRWRR